MISTKVSQLLKNPMKQRFQLSFGFIFGHHRDWDIIVSHDEGVWGNRINKTYGFIVRDHLLNLHYLQDIVVICCCWVIDVTLFHWVWFIIIVGDGGWGASEVDCM